MGMIRAAGLGYEYLRYEEEGQEPEVTKAIEDVSLEIQKGQFIAVLGHNGSGKSTLAKHINALLVPTEGTMWVDDMKTTDEEDVWKIRQKAGMVFQNRITRSSEMWWKRMSALDRKIWVSRPMKSGNGWRRALRRPEIYIPGPLSE